MLREFPTAEPSKPGVLILQITASPGPAQHRTIGMWFRAVPLPRTGVTHNPVAHHSGPAPTIRRAARNKEAAPPTAVRSAQTVAAAPTAVQAAQAGAAVPTAARVAPP